MNKKISWKDIRGKLNHCSSRDLIGIIGDLYKLQKDNKNYLNTVFFNDDDTIEKYKEQITKGLIFEPFEQNPKLAMARKAVMDYKKAKGVTAQLVELMIHYLDCGSFMSSKFGYYESGYYSSINSMYKNLQSIIDKEPELAKMYQDSIKKILKKYKSTGYFE